MERGISPRQFMDGMQNRVMVNSKIPNTKEQFFKNYEEFKWEHKDNEQFFTAIRNRNDLHCLILCTDWCPDVIWNVPVLFRVMEESGIQAEVLLMEEHLETMDLFLIDGGRAQPIAVFLNKDGEVLANWGARPAYIQAVMDEFKIKYPDRQLPEYQENIQRVYGEIGDMYHDGNKYQNVMIKELEDLFKAFII
jgi:hypothetical protein